VIEYELKASSCGGVLDKLVVAHMVKK